MTGSDAKSDYHGFRTPPLSVGREEWEQFGKVAGSRRRSEMIRAFIAWYLRKPGAKLPTRPPTREPHDPASGA